MKKPSDRIREILIEEKGGKIQAFLASYIPGVMAIAIIKYLDEQSGFKSRSGCEEDRDV